MKRIGLTLMAILLVAFPMFSQIVSIPDTAFLYALIEEGVDTNEDSLISQLEADAVMGLHIGVEPIQWGFDHGKIKSLAGIEWFKNLTSLSCEYHQIDSLDLSENLALTHLSCWGNYLKNLDISKHRNLIDLDCHYNLLTSLDVTKNIKLVQLQCGLNKLTDLDVSQNTLLELLDCYDMPTLYHVCISESEILNIYSQGSPNINISSRCGANIVTIPDTAFLYALLDEGVDTNGDSLISYAEAGVTIGLGIDSRGISNLTGIEAFTELEILRCNRNKLTSLDVSNNIELRTLLCGSNHLTSLDITSNTLLESLHCGISCDRTGWCPPGNQITALDVSNNTLLDFLECRGNKLTTLDVSHNPLLEVLWCNDNQISSLDIPNNLSLSFFSCSSNKIDSIDVTKNKELVQFSCYNNNLFSLDVSKNTSLESLKCGNNYIHFIDLSSNTDLLNLDITDMPSLNVLCVREMPFPPSGVNVDTTGSPNVEFKDCSGTGIDIYNPTGLSIYPNPTKNLLIIETDCTGCHSIEITSLNGQLILNTKREGPNNQIDLSSFEKGIYFITIRSKDFVTTRKIIKM